MRDGHIEFQRSPNTVRVVKFRRLQWAVYKERFGKTSNVYRNFVIKQLGRSSIALEAKIKMVLTEIGFEFGRWVEPFQNRYHFQALVSVVLNWRM